MSIEEKKIRSFLMLLTWSCLVLLTSTTGAFTQSRAHVVMNGHWGLAIQPYEAQKREIITYLPTGLLLFDVGPNEIVPAENRISAMTQDSVEVYVRNSARYIQPLSIFGERNYMAHRSFSICVDDNCSDSDPMATINAGEAFSVKELRNGDAFEVWTNRTAQQDLLIGFVSNTEIRRHLSSGTITDLRQNHPRYNITKRSSRAATNDCIEDRQQTSVLSSEEDFNSVDRLALSAFGYGTIQRDGDRLEMSITTEYGDKRKLVEFRVYELRERAVPVPPARGRDAENTQRLMVVQINYDCDDFGDPLFMEDVSIIDIGESRQVESDGIAYETATGRTVHIRADRFTRSYLLTPFGTPDSLSRDGIFGRYPYLWSVNTPKQYFDLIERLTGFFEDRSMAGFFLGEFNRSCPKRFRQGADAKQECLKHSYDDQ